MTHEGRMAAVERRLEQLEQAEAREALNRDALRRFQTTGPLAVPMNAHHVAAVLGVKGVSAVHAAVKERRIARRWGGPLAFHPDDVREFIHTRKANRSEAQKKRWAEGRGGRRAKPQTEAAS